MVIATVPLISLQVVLSIVKKSMSMDIDDDVTICLHLSSTNFFLYQLQLFVAICFPLKGARATGELQISTNLTAESGSNCAGSSTGRGKGLDSIHVIIHRIYVFQEHFSLLVPEAIRDSSSQP